MQNLILFQTVSNSDGEFGSELQKKLKNKKNLIRADKFSFHKIKFSYEKLVIRVKEEKEKMQNLIFFQTVINSDGKFVSTAQETEKYEKFYLCRAHSISEK